MCSNYITDMDNTNITVTSRLCSQRTSQFFDFLHIIFVRFHFAYKYT